MLWIHLFFFFLRSKRSSPGEKNLQQLILFVCGCRHKNSQAKLNSACGAQAWWFVGKQLSFIILLMLDNKTRYNNSNFIICLRFVLNCTLHHAYAGYNVTYLILRLVSALLHMHGNSKSASPMPCSSPLTTTTEIIKYKISLKNSNGGKIYPRVHSFYRELANQEE